MDKPVDAGCEHRLASPVGQGLPRWMASLIFRSSTGHRASARDTLLSLAPGQQSRTPILASDELGTAQLADRGAGDVGGPRLATFVSTRSPSQPA